MRVGTAIGGVLVAVLVVCAIVPPKSAKNKNKTPVVLKTGSNTANNPDNGGTGAANAASDGSGTNPAGPAHDAEPGGAPPAGANDGGSIEVAVGSNNGAANAPAEPAAGPHTDPSQPSQPAPAPEHAATDWRTILGADAVEDSATGADTPAPANTGSAKALDHGAVIHNDTAPRNGASPASGTHDSTSGASATPPPVTGTGTHSAPVSSTAGSQTHKIAAGETFSSIAKSVYGDSRYYKQIAAANPTINPARLRPGTTIQLPDRAAVVSAAAPGTATTASGTLHASPAPSPAIDTHSEYRIQGNDSLYKISMKLYNTPNRVDQIYQLNKDRIGADPAKLKVNTILRLPVPPTETVSR